MWMKKVFLFTKQRSGMCSFFVFFMDFFDIGFVFFFREALICLGIGLTQGRFENFATNWISIFCLLLNLWKVLLFVEPGNLSFSWYFNSPNLQKATRIKSVLLFYPFLPTFVTARNLSIFQLTVLVLRQRHLCCMLCWTTVAHCIRPHSCCRSNGI